MPSTTDTSITGMRLVTGPVIATRKRYSLAAARRHYVRRKIATWISESTSRAAFTMASETEVGHALLQYQFGISSWSYATRRSGSEAIIWCNTRCAPIFAGMHRMARHTHQFVCLMERHCRVTKSKG
jgi:hypothetical protein